MQFLDAAGRLVVAVAFAWAATAKLADLPGLRATLYRSRVTRPWVPQLSVGLPAAELALALLLVSTRPSWLAALASAGLLGAFIWFLATDVHAGEGCNCFGRQTRSSSRRSGLVRDVLLLAALMPALVRGPDAGRWGVPDAAEIPFLLAGTLVVGAGTAWAVRRGNRPGGRGRSDPGRRRVGKPPVEVPGVRRAAPRFDLPALDGSRLRTAAALVFVEPGCGQCESVLPLIAEQADVVVVVVAGEPAASAIAARYALPPERVGFDPEGAVADAFAVPAIPAACRISPDHDLTDAAGRPTARLAVGADAVRSLLTHAR